MTQTPNQITEGDDEKQLWSIEQAYLKECLEYNPETGVLTWLKRPLNHFPSERICRTWNAKYSGKSAGSLDKRQGYIRLMLNDRKYLSHRLIWLYVTGERPENHIDHINHIRSDNRWLNLAAVTQTENNRNSSIPRNNTSGVVGVGWCSQTHKWKAQIRINGRNTSLGYFARIDDAVAARKAKELEIGYHENHGKKEVTC